MKHLHFLPLTLLYCMLNFFSGDSALEYPPASQTTVLKTTTTNATAINNVERLATNIILQSKDGGQTWQDISYGLPANEQPEGFFAGESEIYVHVKNVLYSSKSNLKTPVWEKENVLDPGFTSITFNRSGVMAYNDEGEIYQKRPAAGTWLPIHSNFKKQSMRYIFETSDGTVLLGYDHGLYKSTDKGKNWRQVQREGGVMNIVESDGVLIATGTKGIMRSTDNGEHWEWVISEGGVGIAVERIDGGFAAIAYNTRIQARRIHISLDGGQTWNAISEGLQPSASISSIKQFGNYLLCGHPDGIFRSSDMGKTWNPVHPSVNNEVAFIKTFTITSVDKRSDNKKVFKLFVSGHVLYAVARNSGC